MGSKEKTKLVPTGCMYKGISGLPKMAIRAPSTLSCDAEPSSKMKPDQEQKFVGRNDSQHSFDGLVSDPYHGSQ